MTESKGIVDFLPITPAESFRHFLNMSYNLIIAKDNNVIGFESVTQEMLKENSTLYILSILEHVDIEFDLSETMFFVVNFKPEFNLPRLSIDDHHTIIAEIMNDDIMKVMSILTRSKIIDVLMEEKKRYAEEKIINESPNVISLKLRRAKK